MSFTIGNNFRTTLFGQSHAEAVGCVIEGLTPGFDIDIENINRFMRKRQGGKSCTTPRKEQDAVEFISGIGPDNSVCEAPVVITIANKNIDTVPYEITRHIPRPSHADFTSYITYAKHEDWRGGGSFSARLTAPLCAAGAIAKQVLANRGIQVAAHISQVGDVFDDLFYTNAIIDENEKYSPYSEEALYEQIKSLDTSSFPCINQQKAIQIQKLIEQIHSKGDSIGASVECVVVGLPVGVGDPFFDGLDAQLARAIFSIPAVKSFEMGVGVDCISMMGSEYNDAIGYVDETPTCLTNNCGGVLGGLSNGNPIVFKTGFKPTPTISKPQQTIDFDSKENISYSFEGRHDPCVGVRAVAVVEAMAAIVVLDSLMHYDMRCEQQKALNLED